MKIPCLELFNRGPWAVQNAHMQLYGVMCDAFRQMLCDVIGTPTEESSTHASVSGGVSI